MRRFQVKIGAKYKNCVFANTEFDIFQPFLALIIFSSRFQSIMSPLLRKNDIIRLYHNGKNYHFIGVSAPFRTFWYTKVVKTRSLALLFPCAPVLQVVKHVVKKHAPEHRFLMFRGLTLYISDVQNLIRSKQRKS